VDIRDRAWAGHSPVASDEDYRVRPGCRKTRSASPVSATSKGVTGAETVAEHKIIALIRVWPGSGVTCLGDRGLGVNRLTYRCRGCG